MDLALSTAAMDSGSSASNKFAPPSRPTQRPSAPYSTAPIKSAPRNSVPSSVALHKSACMRLAPRRFAIERSAPLRFTRFKIALCRFTPVRSAFERFAPERSARTPFSPPDSAQSLCWSRISASSSSEIPGVAWSAAASASGASLLARSAFPRGAVDSSASSDSLPDGAFRSS